MLKLVKNTTKKSYTCLSCPIMNLCYECISFDGSIKNGAQQTLNNARFWSSNQIYFDEAVQMAKECRKQFPNYAIIDDILERKSQHVLCNNWGHEIISANTWWGLMGKALLVSIGGIIFFAIIASIICGIASLFS